MSVTERTNKARACATFGKVTERDSDGRAKVVLVPGSEAKLYQVIIRRNGQITCECNLQTSMGNIPCQGNSGKTLCYHSMAALVLAAGEKEANVSFCDCVADAQRLENLGQTVTRVSSWQGAGVLWLAVRKPAPAPIQLTASEETRLAIRDAMYGEA